MTLSKDRIGGLLMLAFRALYAWKIGDIRLLPFQANQTFTPSTIPEVLAVLDTGLSVLVILFPCSDQRLSLTGLNWPLGLAFLVLMSIYGFTVRLLGFLAATSLFLIIGFAMLGERKAASQLGSMAVTKEDVREMVPVIGRSSVLGFLIGVLPGAGATIASFLAYGIEQRIAGTEKGKEFGKGSVRGLAAPETANSAAATGSFVPLLTLGIQGSGTTAIMLGALIGYGIQPGPRLYIDQPDVFWTVIISMWLGNMSCSF